MNHTKTNRICSIVLALTIPLVFMLFTGSSVPAQASQKSSDELLLEIMDLHAELVTNEVFLAQAKLLGVYVEAAQQSEEPNKIKIYTKILTILSKIKELPATIAAQPTVMEATTETDEESLEAKEEESKAVYEPGAALLEIFKADSWDNLPDLPVIRTYWERDLAYLGGFLIPERAFEIGGGERYIARFSFYYEAVESGKYGFNVQHPTGRIFVRGNTCKLAVGGVDIVRVGDEPTGQGVCNLRKGFHRVEFYLVSGIFGYYKPEQDKPAGPAGTRVRPRSGYTQASFQVKVLTPDAFDSVPLTKDMMLLKKE